MTRPGVGAVARDLDTLFGPGALGRLTDGQLLAIFLSDRGEPSEAAFRALVVRHGPMVWGVCRRGLANTQDAEDAFQATFLLLIRKASSVRVDDSLGRWLYGVSLKVTARARLISNRRLSRESDAGLDLATTWDDHPERCELSRVIDEELSRVPSKYRAVVVLCDLQGLSHDEAARQLSCPTGTIKSRLTRGRDRLKARLLRRGYGPTALVWLSPRVPHQLEQATAHLGARLASSLPITGWVSSSVVLLTKGVIQTMIATKLKFAGVAVLAASCAAWTTRWSPDRAGRADEKAPRQAGGVVASGVPSVLIATSPSPESQPRRKPDKDGVSSPARTSKAAPWETTVRVRVRGLSTVGYGSGKVIQSSPGNALVLTCAHVLDPKGGKPPSMKDAFPYKISVDLFDGKLGADRAQTRWTGESLEGTLVDTDAEHDLALIQIEPGRELPTSRMRQASSVALGQSLVSVGCSEGQDATAWSTSLKSRESRNEGTKSPVTAMWCEHAPKQGRSGGGLFTLEGELVGVCLNSRLEGDIGEYADIEMTNPLLERLPRSVIDSPWVSMMPPTVETGRKPEPPLDLEARALHSSGNRESEAASDSSDRKTTKFESYFAAATATAQPRPIETEEPTLERPVTSRTNRTIKNSKEYSDLVNEEIISGELALEFRGFVIAGLVKAAQLKVTCHETRIKELQDLNKRDIEAMIQVTNSETDETKLEAGRKAAWESHLKLKAEVKKMVSGYALVKKAEQIFEYQNGAIGTVDLDKLGRQLEEFLFDRKGLSATDTPRED